MYTLSSTKNALFAYIFCVLGLVNSAHAQTNRYGMKLKEHKGAFQVVDKNRICKILKDSCLNLPKDIYEPWKGYAPKLIQAEDYTNFTTKSYIFKEYPTKGYTLNMEVDMPKIATNKPYPFVIWVHGGGWGGGSAEAFKNQSQYLASRGIAGVRITYSLKNQGGSFKMGFDELKAALQFVKENREELELDINKYGWAGGSAGTPLSALVAMQDASSGCKLFIGYNGIYVFENNRHGNFCGGKEITNTYLKNINDWRSISAINYISDNPNNIPAVILFHGTGDITISRKQSVALYHALIKKKGKAELHLYPYYSHAFFNQNKSDLYEDITIKTHKFVENIFKVLAKK
jgi:acetyl esterase/lipase